MTDLPVIESCTGCGACCLEQGAPPDYVALSLNPQFAGDASFAADAVRMADLPETARGLLSEYLRATAAGTTVRNGPCVWFDPATTSCRFYDWRPSTCRVFEINSPGCRIYRRRHGVDPT
ncbi:MAG: YkgJ family cysteine cluster protein [Planctomycetaceae bacterium]